MPAISEQFAWSAGDLSAAPGFPGNTFTVTGKPDSLTISDNTHLDEVPTDSSAIVLDQNFSGTIDGVPLSENYSLTQANLVTDGVNEVWVYTTEPSNPFSTSPTLFLSEQPLIVGTTYSVVAIDFGVNIDNFNPDEGSQLYTDFTDGVVEGTDGDDVITGASGFTDHSNEQVDGNDGVGGSVNTDTITGGLLEWLHADQSDEGVSNDTFASWTASSSLVLSDSMSNPIATSALTHDTTNVVCFVRGSRIAAAKGEIPVEQLKVGDRVITRDNGYQTVRWIGSTKRKARPVLFKKGSLLRNHSDLLVSQYHRMLLNTPVAQLTTGENEVLVSAKFMIDHHNVLLVEERQVEYFHIMFDRHEIVLSEGCWTESFHPGQVGLDAFSEKTRKEILGLFPELEGRPSIELKHTARTVLDRHQARVIMASRALNRVA